MDRESRAAQTLLKAWRGEIEADAMYRIIAQRERDPKRAGILREMAQAESGHRVRLEARMTELGITIPDASTVRIPAWRRLQARLAPVGRLLASMEAAESTEIDDLYKTPTGDAGTDELLASIRTDEQSHAQAIRGMTSSSGNGQRSHEETKLQRILGRERWHRGGSG
ncbi:MAG TPA: ferritin family protein, partial [Candidatus Eremiobacteraceae bacterium]|nr:ferritin family protein [Candidatus Eremiobacteraceae bacterium]